MDPIQSLRPVSVSPAGARSPIAAPSAGFADAFSRALDEVSTQQSGADKLAREVQLDNPAVSLEESVIATQKAAVSFQALVQARNRLVQAYHDVFNMPV